MEIKICKNPKNDKETLLQLWQTSCLLNSIKLEEKGIKSVYFDDVFGKPKFSQDGKKLIFLVELDKSKIYQNYFSIKNQTHDKENPKETTENNNNKQDNGNDDFFKNMKKFEYKQEFGEALDGKSDPVIAIYDILRNDIGFINLDKINDYKSNKEQIKIYPATPF